MNIFVTYVQEIEHFRSMIKRKLQSNAVLINHKCYVKSSSFELTKAFQSSFQAN